MQAVFTMRGRQHVGEQGLEIVRVENRLLGRLADSDGSQCPQVAVPAHEDADVAEERADSANRF